MKLGIISDTHDRLDSIEKAFHIFMDQKVEAIIHCGDWVSPFTIEFFDAMNLQYSKVPVYSVFGNNEGDIKRILERNSRLAYPVQFAEKTVLEKDFEGKKIAAYHGHDKHVLTALIKSQDYDAVFCGHTHKEFSMIEGKTLVFNPGSTSYARESRIIDQASVGVYDTATNEAEHIYLG